MKSVIIIPARLESARLPRKMLLHETGKTLIEHTYEAAKKSKKASSVVVATGSREIFDKVHSFGGCALMTDSDHHSGTDRVAEIAGRMFYDNADIIVNLQGDEPEISGEAIDLIIELLEKNPDAVMSTLATPIRDDKQLDDPACVKVILNDYGRAWFFTRGVFPKATREDGPLQHIGLYAYRRDFLLRFAAREPDTYERLEKLEQIRAIRMGAWPLVGVISKPTFGIDTPEDYQAFVKRFNKKQILDGN